MTRHDPYAVPPPAGPHDYVVDDEPIRRAPQGSPVLLKHGHSAVRLAPDCEYRAWRNECLTVREERAAADSGAPETVLRVSGSVCLGPRGLGIDLFDFEAVIIDPIGAGTVSVAAGSCERGPVERKLLKARDWYRAEFGLREDGKMPLLTAAQLWLGEVLDRRSC